MKKVTAMLLAVAMLAWGIALQTVALADEQYTVDFGTAAWTVEGETVTARAESKDLTAGSVELSAFDTIRLEGFDGGRMVARVNGENNFSAVLEPNGDNEVCLGRLVNKDTVLPPELLFEVAAWDGPGPVEDPAGPGEDPAERIFTVDFGTAAWTVDGTAVTARVEGKDLTAGPVELTEADVIKLEGFDGGRMAACVSAADGFGAELEPNGDNEVSLGRPKDPNIHLPGELSFTVNESRPGEPGGPGEPGEPGEPGDPAGRTVTVDFGGAKWTVNGTEVTAVAWGMDLTQGVVEIGARDEIRLDGLDPATMQVRVYGENDFSAELAPNDKNEVCLDAPVDPNVHIPDSVRFAVEPRQQDDPGEIGEAAGVVLTLKNGEAEAHPHAQDILQMTPEEIGITPEEYEAVLGQLRKNLAAYDCFISLYEIFAEKDGAEIPDAQFGIAIDMTDAMLGYGEFKLVSVNKDDFSVQDAADLAQNGGKLTGDLPHPGVYALVGSEIVEVALLGDVDGSGEIEAADARLALRIAVGLEPEMGEGTEAFAAANVTEIEAGEVTAADARCILRRAVGFEDPEFGV